MVAASCFKFVVDHHLQKLLHLSAFLQAIMREMTSANGASVASCCTIPAFVSKAASQNCDDGVCRLAKGQFHPLLVVHDAWLLD